MSKLDAITFDPLFTSKIFNLDPAATSEINFDNEIKQFYGDQDPIYFRMPDDKTPHEALIAFGKSPKFSQFITQLEACFSAITRFVTEQNIQVQTKLADLTGDLTGQRVIEVSANVLLNRFLNRLKGDHFSDRRTLMYDDGKRYIEMLSILIKKDSLNLEDRALHIRTLIDEDALEYCAEGTCTRLQETVENLKTLTSSSFYTWINTFLKNQIIESIKNPISEITDANVTKRLLQLIGLEEAAMEIHAINWIKKQLRDRCKLTFIEEVKDSYIDLIENKLTIEQRTLVNSYLERIYQGFKKKVTATKLVEFISYNIYQKTLEQQGYTEQSTFLEEKLKILGDDLTFSLGELFREEDGNLKTVTAFYKTIIFRLLESDFFERSQLESFRTKNYELKIFKKNLALDLIKDLKEDGEYFSRIVDILGKLQGIGQLLEDLLPEDRIDFLKKIIQTPDDLVIFLNKNHPLSSASIVDSLSAVSASLGFSQTSLHLPDAEYSLSQPSLFEKVFSILRRLEGPIDQAYTPRNFFYDKLITPTSFKLLANNQLKLRLKMNDFFASFDARDILDSLLKINIKDFSNFYFPNFEFLTSVNEIHAAYIKRLDFSEKNFNHAEFHTPIISCNLKSAQMHAVKFYKLILDSSFFEAQLQDTEFYNPLFEVNFFKTVLKNIKFLPNDASENLNAIAPLEMVFFIDALLVNVNIAVAINNGFFVDAIIQDSYFYSVKKTSFRNAILTATRFSILQENISFRNAQLTDVKFNQVAYTQTVNAYDGVAFDGATLENVSFEKLEGTADDGIYTINKVLFQRATLKNVNIAARLSNGLLMDSTIQDSYFYSIGKSSLRNAIITKTTFNILQGNIFFKKAQLTDVKFNQVFYAIESNENQGFFQGNSFEEATLKNVLFKEGKADADISIIEKIVFQGASLTNVNVECIISDVNFIGATIQDSYFHSMEKSYFKNAIVTKTTFNILDGNISFKNAQLSDVKFNQIAPPKENGQAWFFFDGIAFEGVTFEKAILKNVSFKKLEETADEGIYTIKKIIFQEASLTNVDIESVISDVNFIDATLTNVDIAGELSNSLLVGATIQDSYFYSVKQVSFREAILTKTTFNILEENIFFKNAKLTNVKFNQVFYSKESNKNGISFEGATLQDVSFEKSGDLEIVTGIENINFKDTTLKNVQIKTIISDCSFDRAIIEGSFFDYVDTFSSYQNAIITATQFNYLVGTNNFKGAQLTDVTINNINAGVLDEGTTSFQEATLKDVLFGIMAFIFAEKVDFTRAKLENLMFNQHHRLVSPIFKETSFKNCFFEDLTLEKTDFAKAVFDHVEFIGQVTLSDCDLAGSTIKQTALNNVFLDKNNLENVKLEEVTLVPYQLIDLYRSGVRDFSTITLVNPSENDKHLLHEINQPEQSNLKPSKMLKQSLTPEEINDQVKAFLTSQTLPEAILSLQAVHYLYDKAFNFEGIKLEHINFQENNFRDIIGATINFEQAKQLFSQGRENFASIKVLIGQQEVVQIANIILDAPEINQTRNKKIQFLTELIAYSVRLEEIQKVYYRALAFGLFGVLTDTEKLSALEKISHFVLQQGNLDHKISLEALRKDILDSFETTTLKNLFLLGLDRFAIENEPFKLKTMSELLTVLSSYCSNLGSRKKRSIDACASLAGELTGEDEALLATQRKEIDVLIAAGRRLFWERAITPVMSELNRSGNKWLPLLETAKPLSYEKESIEFINIQTQEKQIRELPGSASLDFLESLQVLYNYIPSEKLQANVQKLADDLQVNKPLTYQAQENADHFGGDFMLSIGLATKGIIELVNKKGCEINSSKAKCYFNIATLSSMYFMPALQLSELIGKEFLLTDSPLLKSISMANKALGVVGGLFLLAQDGLDIAKLVKAKNEKERAVYTTQLMIDGTTTVQMGISIVAEELLATASGALIVPLIGVSVGLPTLVHNYETLLEHALAMGRVLNKMHEQQKKGGYELVIENKTKDEWGNEQMVPLINITQPYMQPIETVVIRTINFMEGELLLRGPLVYWTGRRGNCYYVNYDKDKAFDFRESLGYSPKIYLNNTQLDYKSWILPSLPNYYLKFKYGQVPTISLRNDKELATLRTMQANTGKFIASLYCWPTEYAPINCRIEYEKTDIQIILDSQPRNLFMPTLSRELQGWLTYTIKADGLKEGQTVIYLNPGVSINLYQSDENYSWVLNGQNLPQDQDSIEFTETGLKIGDIEIQSIFGSSVNLSSSEDSFGITQKNKRLHYIDKQGHGFILDHVQSKQILTTINYAALQKQQQTLEQFVKYQGADPQSVFRVVNYSNLQDGYQGIATYVGHRESLFYTSDIPEELKDAVLIYLQGNNAFFYHAAGNRLWCTNTDFNRLCHYYAFPEKIVSVDSQENYLLVNVANRFYYKIDIESRQSLLFAIEDSELLSFYLRMKDPSNIKSFTDIVKLLSNNTDGDNLDLHDDEKTTNYSYYSDYDDRIDHEKYEWQELTEVLQHNISTILSDATQSDRSYPQFAGEIRLPDINEASVALYVTPHHPPFIWFRKEGENYQVISMQRSRLNEKYIQVREYLETYVTQGYYLGCFTESHRPEQRVLSYFVKENFNDTMGKIHLQTVAANQSIVSFVNTHHEKILNFAVKKAAWDNNNRLVVLTTENIFKTVDAQGQTQPIGFSAVWTRLHPAWWQAIPFYLANQTIGHVFISVQGVQDPQGKDLVVYYDPTVKQFVIMPVSASSGLRYSGKIGAVYFFTQANSAYQTTSIMPSKVVDLFSEKQQMPLFEKIVDYISIISLNSSTQQELEFSKGVPQFSVTLQDFRMDTPYYELAFDPVAQTWQIIKIKSSWVFEQKTPLMSASCLFSQINNNFRLNVNQLHTPIPFENSPFWLVEQDHYLRTSQERGTDNEFTYIGQSQDSNYYFYDVVENELILLMSKKIRALNETGYSAIKNNEQVSQVESRIAVKQAAKLDETTVSLEINPFQIKGEDIPLLKNCSQLLLRFTSDSEGNNITLPNSLFNHYPTIICQAVQAINITLPYDYSWTASQGKNKLVISNGHARLIIPHANNSTLPNITLQVIHEKDNRTQIFIDNIRTIAEKFNTKLLLTQVPILDYWRSKSKLLTEGMTLTENKQVGNYQKASFINDAGVAKLRDRPKVGKEPQGSLLSQLSIAAGIALVTAPTTLLLTVTTGLGYVFIRRFRRPNAAAIRNVVEAVSIPLVARLPVAHAQKTENEIIPYNNAEFFHAKDCLVTETPFGKLGICVNNKKLIGWLTNKAWYAGGFTTQENLINDLQFRKENLDIYHPEGTQSLPYADMNPTSLEEIYPYLADDLKILLYKQARDEQIFQTFYHHANFLTLHWFVNQLSLHTPCGDILLKLGLKVNWQQRDDSYLLARLLIIWMELLKQKHTLTKQFMENLFAGLLEISIVCPPIQNLLQIFPYGKQTVRLGADFLQFGFNSFMYIPNLLDWIFADRAGIHELTWSLRLIFSLFTMTEDLNYGYLGVALFILPQLPVVLESLGIPVTRYVRSVLDNLTQLYIFQSLINTMNIEPDPERKQQQHIECIHAEQRAEVGQKRRQRYVKSLFNFFKPAEAVNEAQTDNKKTIQIGFAYR